MVFMTKRVRESYNTDNRRAAEIILQAPERYEGALLQWANACIERLDREDLARRGLLFRIGRAA